ncbi:MAG: inositol phosphatase, partial [Candidatus Synechococcus spongiarum 142]
MQRTIAAWQEQLGPLLDRVAARQMEDFGQIGAEKKADGSLITTCDRWSDHTIGQWLQEHFPTTGILSEEGNTRVPRQEWAWILDPLDGTTNFTYGIPHWTISLALLYQGRPMMGWLEIPPLRQRIIVVRGEGVDLNGHRLQPPTDVITPNACASLCTRSMVVLQRRPDHRFPCKLRMFGVASTNMAGVALGQSLGALEASPKIW